MGWASRRAAAFWITLGKARSSRTSWRCARGGLAPRRGVLEQPRKGQERQDELALLGGELPGGNLSDLLLAEPGPLEDARVAGVGVLHVEDGVLVRLLYGKLQVEVDLAPVRGPHVEVPRHVLPHLVEQLI